MNRIFGTCRYCFLLLLIGYVPVSQADDFHMSTEPLYFLLEASNLALDYRLGESWSAGFQYAAIDGGRSGRNLSGLQFFYSRKARVFENSEVLKIYVGRLSPNTKLLGIETSNQAIPMLEFLYGYRWVFKKNLTLSIQTGVFFTEKKIYPGLSIPVGYMF